MTRVLLEQEALSKLRDARGILELCDEHGNPIGFFSPITPAGGAGYEDVEVPYTDEEILQLAQQPRGRPLAEILAELDRNA